MKRFSPIGDVIKSIQNTLPDLSALPDKDPDAQCTLCDGYGHIIDENGARPCMCVKKKVFNTEVQDARIPQRYMDVSLDSFETRSSELRVQLAYARQYVSSYALDCPQGLYIHGPTGTGKTHLAVGILKGLIARGFDGVFYNIVDLLDNIRSTFDPQMPAAPKSRLIQDLQRQILVLDDFGVQKTSSWVSDRLYALINRRYQDCKTVIITSNLSFNDLLQQIRVDGALSSRIIEMCVEMKIEAKEDYRLRKINTEKNKQGRRRLSTKSEDNEKFSR